MNLKRFPALLLGLALVGCGSPAPNGLNAGQNLAAQILNQQCHGYIDNQPLWQLAKMTLGTELEQHKAAVCQCAAEESLRNAKGDQLLALANPSRRVEAVINLLGPTVPTCYQKLRPQLNLP